jgi:hypothetical protein
MGWVIEIMVLRRKTHKKDKRSISENLLITFKCSVIAKTTLNKLLNLLTL